MEGGVTVHQILYEYRSITCTMCVHPFGHAVKIHQFVLASRLKSYFVYPHQLHLSNSGFLLSCCTIVTAVVVSIFQYRIRSFLNGQYCWEVWRLTVIIMLYGLESRWLFGLSVVVHRCCLLIYCFLSRGPVWAMFLTPNFWFSFGQFQPVFPNIILT